MCKYDELGNAPQKPVFDAHTSAALTSCSQPFSVSREVSASGRARRDLTLRANDPNEVKSMTSRCVARTLPMNILRPAFLGETMIARLLCEPNERTRAIIICLFLWETYGGERERERERGGKGRGKRGRNGICINSDHRNTDVAVKNFRAI